MDWTAVRSDDGAVLYWTYNSPIFKPSIDATQYRLIRLKNGQQVLLGSDPEAISSGVSVVIPAGSLDSPPDLPGFACLVETCIHQFIKDNSPADVQHSTRTLGEALSLHQVSRFQTLTDRYWTSYSVQLAPAGLKEALRYLSALFTPPSLTVDDVKAAVVSVQGAFQHLKLHDGTRLSELNRYLSKPGAAFRPYFTGDKQTIAPCPNDDGSQDWDALLQKVLDWWHANYLRRPGSVVVLGNESLDELTKAVCEYFTVQFPSSEFNLWSLPCKESKMNSPWSHEQEGTIIYAQSVRGLKLLSLYWVVPLDVMSYGAKLSDMVVSIIQLCAPGSLFNVLKEKGWATYIIVRTECGDLGEGYEYFVVTITLTKKGLENWASVACHIHEYLSLLRENAAPQQLVEDIARTVDTEFRYSHKGDTVDYAHDLAQNILQPYSRQDLIRGHRVSPRRDPSELQTFVRELLQPSKTRVMICAHAYDDDDWRRLSVPDSTRWSEAPGYGTKYFVRRMDAELLVERTTEQAELHGLRLPQSSVFAPGNVSVLPAVAKDAEPTALVKRPGRTLWYKRDNKYFVPRGVIYCQLHSVHLLASAKARAYLRLLVRMVNAVLADEFHNASHAGSSVTLKFYDIAGIVITLTGYSDQLPTLFLSTFASLLQCDHSEDLFSKCLKDLREDLRHSKYGGLEPTNGSLLNRADMLVKVLSKRAASPREMLAALEEAKISDMQDFLTVLRTSMQCKLLVFGNYGPEDAVAIAQSCFDKLAPFQECEGKAPSTVLRLHAGINYILELPRRGTSNSQVSYHCGISNERNDIRSFIITSLIGHLVARDMDSRLSIPYDFGHYTEFGPTTFAGGMWFSFTVEVTHEPAYAERCIDHFFMELLGVLQDMTEEEFAQRKAAMKVEFQRGAVSGFSEDALRLGNILITETSTGADASGAEICQVAESLTKAEVVEVFRTRIDPRSPERRKFSVRLGPARKLSASAACDLLEKLSPYKPNRAFVFPVIPEVLLLADAVKICVQAFPNAPEGAVENVVRTAAELYPYYTKAQRPVQASSTSRRFKFAETLEGFRSYLADDLDED